MRADRRGGGSVHRIGRGDGGGGNDGRTFLTAPPRRAFLRSESGSQLLLSSSASVGGMPRRHRPTMTVSAHPQPRRERHLGHQGSSIPTLAPHPRPSSPPAACRLLPPVIAPPASTRPPPTQVPHAMFRPGAYRRALKHLTAMLHVVGHTTALQLNRRQRFETFGPCRTARRAPRRVVPAAPARHPATPPGFVVPEPWARLCSVY